MNTREMKRAVLAKSQQAYAEGMFAGTSGNLSLYDPESGLVAITPSGVPYPGMQEEEIVLITLDGNVVEGDKEPSSEWPMHTVVYSRRPDVRAVVHTHSPFATSCAVSHTAVPLILIEMVFFLYGDVPVARYAPPGTKELGESALEKLRDRAACLLANHGVLAVGKDLQSAHLAAVYTEDAAKIFSLSHLSGPPAAIPNEELNRMRATMGLGPV